MIGPTSTIISKTECTEGVIALIHDIIDRIAAERDDDAFQVASAGTAGNNMRAFDYAILPIEDSEIYGEEDLEDLEELLDGVPQMEVNLYAMSGEPEDHRILGQLSLEIAEAINGFIDLHGELPEAPIEHIAGTLIPREVELAMGGTAIHYLADAAFMRDWLQSADFVMAE